MEAGGFIWSNISILVVEWITFEARQQNPRDSRSGISILVVEWITFEVHIDFEIFLTQLFQSLLLSGLHSKIRYWVQKVRWWIYFNPCCWVDYIRSEFGRFGAENGSLFQSLLLSGLHSKAPTPDLRICRSLISILVVEWITFEGVSGGLGLSHKKDFNPCCWVDYIRRRFLL